MKHSLQILKSKNIFNRHKYPFPNALNIKYFWTHSCNHWGFWGITKLSNPELQENGMPKKCLDAVLLLQLFTRNSLFGQIWSKIQMSDQSKI